MLLKDICPSFSCPSCKKLLNFFDLRTFVARIYGFFPQIFLIWKAKSADIFTFWMYAHHPNMCPYMTYEEDWSAKKGKKATPAGFGDLKNWATYERSCTSPLPAWVSSFFSFCLYILLFWSLYFVTVYFGVCASTCSAPHLCILLRILALRTFNTSLTSVFLSDRCDELMVIFKVDGKAYLLLSWANYLSCVLVVWVEWFAKNNQMMIRWWFMTVIYDDNMMIEWWYMTMIYDEHMMIR